MPLEQVRRYEAEAGAHGQRFVLFSRRKMDYLKLNEGDWVELISGRGRGAIVQYAKVFAAPSKEKAAIWLPLVIRHLLGLSDRRDSVKGYPQLAIRRWLFSPIHRLEVRFPNAIFHSQVSEEKMDKPDLTIAIRALEFERLTLSPGEIVSARSSNSGNRAILGQACLLSNNPGRALLALGNSMWDFLKPSVDPHFWIIVEKVGARPQR